MSHLHFAPTLRARRPIHVVRLVAAAGLLAGAGISACTGLSLSGSPADQTHRVQAGDSLASIAATYGVSMQAVIEANQARYPNIARPSATNRVKTGWVLVIPERGRPQSVQGPSEPAGAGPADTPATAINPAPAASAEGTWDEALAAELARLTNEARVQTGLTPLTVDEGLSALARERARDIATDYSHAGLRARCATCGENINQAGGAQVAQKLMTGWLNSPGHRATMLIPDVTRLGLGVYRIGDRVYAVQLFEY